MRRERHEGREHPARSGISVARSPPRSALPLWCCRRAVVRQHPRSVACGRDLSPSGTAAAVSTAHATALVTGGPSTASLARQVQTVALAGFGKLTGARSSRVASLACAALADVTVGVVRSCPCRGLVVVPEFDSGQGPVIVCRPAPGVGVGSRLRCCSSALRPE
jgi:hypothetical protein